MQETGKVCKSVVTQSSTVGSATAAEKAGFIEGLEQITSAGVEVGCVATDGHTGKLYTTHVIHSMEKGYVNC